MRRCSECGDDDVLQWVEETLLVVPPPWWDGPAATYTPPDQNIEQVLCLKCGHKKEVIK